jgi:hypothetical protein
MEYIAPNGVIWTRKPAGTSTEEEFAVALYELLHEHDVAHTWNWWQEGRHEREHDKVWSVLQEWDNRADDTKESDSDAEERARAILARIDEKFAQEERRRVDLVTRFYDEDREHLRLRYLRMKADAAFFAHVAAKPANATQREAAERRASESQAAAAQLLADLGDPEEVIDRHGQVPAERRESNLSSHLRYWRYPVLRDFAERDKRRFNAVLKMPPPAPSEMCSECQAPARWHDYDLSLRLFQAQPEPGSKAATLSRLMPGWWGRCPACTAYAIDHSWGGKNTLPDFDGDQWVAMLPPDLRAIFAPEAVTPHARKPKPKPLATIPGGLIGDVMTQLADIQTNHPTAQLRPGRGNTWEVWPS